MNLKKLLLKKYLITSVILLTIGTILCKIIIKNSCILQGKLKIVYKFKIESIVS